MKVAKPPDKETTPAAVYGAMTVEQDGTIKGSYTAGDGKRRALHIYPDRLTDSHLLLSLHADRITPGEWGDFMRAFFLACRLAGITQTTIQTDFE